FSELLGCPISRSLTTSLRLSRTEAPSLPRHYPASSVLRASPPPQCARPVPHGVRLIILITHWGFPCCVRFPCVHAAATTPVQRLGVFLAHLTQPCQPSPEGVAGSACTSTFSRHARRSLALRPAHSRGHHFVTRYPKASDISSPPCLLRLLPAGANRRVGLAPTGKRRLVTAHPQSCRSPVLLGPADETIGNVSKSAPLSKYAG